MVALAPPRDVPMPGSENAARRSLIDCCLRMNALGINQGKSGNASVRWHRGGKDGYLITPSGLPYDETREDDIVWLALDADADRPGLDAGDEVFPQTQREAPAAVASSEWQMHRAIYRARDAGAVVHTHSPYATSLACLPRIQQHGVPAFHYMIAVAGGANIRCASYATFGTQALADLALAALADRRACLLANHGQIAFAAAGPGALAAALALAVEVETLARMYWQALQIGEPAILDDAEMARVLQKFKTYGRARK
jgi:L-fuculose-phosphate aldolase